MTSVTTKTRTLANGTANDAAPVEANFVELYDNDTTLASAVTAIENGNIISGTTLTINSSYSGGSPGNMSFAVERGSLTNTSLRWNESTDKWEFTNDGSNYNQMLAFSNFARLRHGCRINYATAATFTVGTGILADSTGADLMLVTSPLTINLASSGALGIDTGVEASGTWYYVYVIKNPTTGTVSALVSTTNEAVSGSITLPAGYTLKRQLPWAVRNDGSSNIVPWFPMAADEWMLYDLGLSRVTGASTVTNGTANVLGGGTASSWTTVSLTSWVPATSRRVRLLGHSVNSTDLAASVRPNGGSTAGLTLDLEAFASGYVDVATSAAQVIQYQINFTTGSLNLDVVGYQPTEVI